ncbi:hypothetical protein MASR1M32_29700 [Rhodobacter sp.]
MNAIAPISRQPDLPAVTPVAARAKRTPTDWILAGFQALLAGGPDAIRVEALARGLGATKGSFYWHFKDLRSLHAAMLEAFEHLASVGVTAGLRRRGGSPRAQLTALVEAVSALPEGESGGAALEPAMRDWARTDPLARAALQRVDARRLADLCAFLAQAGLDAPRAAEGAARFYAALLGLESLRITCGIEMRGPLMAVAEAILRPEGSPG